MRRWMSLFALLIVIGAARADGNYILQSDGSVKAETAPPAAASGMTYMLGADGSVTAVADEPQEPTPAPAPEPKLAPVAPPAGPDQCVVDVQWAGRGGSGTCVWSENGKSLVITNAHVAPADGPCSVVHEGKRYKAEWVGAADDADLAALLVDGSLPVAPVAAGEPPIGATVRKWGFPGFAGGRKIFGSGPLLRRGTDIIVIGFAPVPGDSGSGLFDEQGRVVGVIQSTNYRTGEAVGLRPLRNFLARIRDRISARAAQRVADYAEACQMVESGKQVLFEVKPGQAEFEGWEPGLYRCWKDADGTCRMEPVKSAARPAAPARPVVPFGNCPPGIR